MAITNLKKRSPLRNPVDRHLHNGKFLTGTGAPAAADAVVKNTNAYPVGTIYLDTTSPGTLYYRIAVAGVTADFSSVALTAGT